MFGHCQPMPMSEVAFPSIERKLRTAGRRWGVLGRDLKVMLSSICLKSFGTRLVCICIIW